MDIKEIKFGRLNIAEFGQNMKDCIDFVTKLSEAAAEHRLSEEDEAFAMCMTILPILSFHHAESLLRMVIEAKEGPIESKVNEGLGGIQINIPGTNS